MYTYIFSVDIDSTA